jgi:hypothetical protein
MFGKEEKIVYPSQYGSHLSMVDKELTASLNEPFKVVLEDESGHYVTTKDRLDDGLADPSRYEVYSRKKAIAEANLKLGGKLNYKAQQEAYIPKKN